MRAAVDSPKNLRSTELLTEELAAQTTAFADYEWDADSLRASKALPTGLKYSLGTDLQRERILLTVTWAATGVERGGVRKYLGPASKTAADQLTSAGWRQVRREVEGRSLELYAHLPEASITAGDILRRIEEVGAQLDRAMTNLKF